MTATVNDESTFGFEPEEEEDETVSASSQGNGAPKRLGVPEERVLVTVDRHANTSAASIPLAMHRLLEEQPELSGGLALQIGFGAGLVYGAQVVVLPRTPEQRAELAGVDLTQFTLAVLQPTDDELAAHEALLAELDKASGGKTLWRAMA